MTIHEQLKLHRLILYRVPDSHPEDVDRLIAAIESFDFDHVRIEIERHVVGRKFLDRQALIREVEATAPIERRRERALASARVLLPLRQRDRLRRRSEFTVMRRLKDIGRLGGIVDAALNDESMPDLMRQNWKKKRLRAASLRARIIEASKLSAAELPQNIAG